MAIKTAIEWCDSTVNPIMGCTGCELYPDHCYAAALCRRYAGRKGWPKEFNKPEYFPGRIEKAIRWPDLTGTERPDKPWLNGLPRIIFVNDLSDGLCPDAPDWLGDHIDAMAISSHVWLLLTKWPHAMSAVFECFDVPNNFWLGTSVLRQADVWRIDWLLEIPAAVHFVSIEPMLEPIDLTQHLWDGVANQPKYSCKEYPINALQLIVVGGESGARARPMRPYWVRSIRDQCRAVGIPFFFKQWGEWSHESQLSPEQYFRSYGKGHHEWPDGSWSVRVGKKNAGHLLDGKEWHEFPRVANE